METSPNGETVQSNQELAEEIRQELLRLERYREYLEGLLRGYEDNNEALSDIFADL